MTNIDHLKKLNLLEYIKDYDQLKNSKSQMLSFQLIRHLEDENFSLQLQNQKLQQKVNDYFTKLNKIYHSRAWRLLGVYKQLETPVINLLKKVTPISFRKKIKSQIESSLSPRPIFHLPASIKREWQKYSRANSSIDFLNFSVIAWNFRFQRPQQIARQLVRHHHRVFYIKNEFTPGAIDDQGYAPFLVNKVEENIYEITLSASRNLFIYDDKPSATDLSIIMASLKNLIHSSNIVNPVAKIDHPFWANFIEKLSMPTIYDCMDHHSGFTESGSHISDLEQKAFTKCDITLTTSHYLHNFATKHHAHEVILLPNAGDYSHFSKASQPIGPTPRDLQHLKTPIIGYYGAIADWFDTSILQDIAQKHPDKSIVLIGQVTNRQVEKLSRQYANIHLLGEKTYTELPSYLSRFDVCIIPFILNELIKATHPVKIYEYLAANKPVVATNMPEIKDLGNCVFFSTPTNFSQTITQALKQKKCPQGQTIAKINTWEVRTKELLKIVSQKFFPKISLIILSYNHPDLMKLTLDSVLKHSYYPHLEIIVVDNASNPETVALLKKYRSVPNVKLIFNHTNYGFAKGNNIGLEKATGDYLVLLNNDIIATPGWLSRLLYYVRLPHVGLVGPVTNSIGNEAKIDITYDWHRQSDLETAVRKYTSAHWGETLSLRNIAAFCWIMSKDIYHQLGGLDERFGRGMFEDDDYCYRVIHHHRKILVSDDVFIHHFGGASFKQIQSEEYQKLFNDNKKKFEDKWHTKWIPHRYRHQ